MQPLAFSLVNYAPSSEKDRKQLYDTDNTFDSTIDSPFTIHNLVVPAPREFYPDNYGLELMCRITDEGLIQVLNEFCATHSLTIDLSDTMVKLLFLDTAAEKPLTVEAFRASFLKKHQQYLSVLSDKPKLTVFGNHGYRQKVRSSSMDHIIGPFNWLNHGFDNSDIIAASSDKGETPTNTLSNMTIVGSTNTVTIDDTIVDKLATDILTNKTVAGSTNIGLTDVQHKFQSMKPSTMEVKYVMLSDDERKEIASLSHESMVEQISYSTEDTSDPIDTSDNFHTYSFNLYPYDYTPSASWGQSSRLHDTFITYSYVGTYPDNHQPSGDAPFSRAADPVLQLHSDIDDHEISETLPNPNVSPIYFYNYID